MIEFLMLNDLHVKGVVSSNKMAQLVIEMLVFHAVTH